jgi:nucleoside-diphosphate-sugar epimerase
MRLLITGASGFLGRNALLALPPSWEVVALYRSENSDFLTFIEEQSLVHVQPVACDLTERVQVKQVLDRLDREFDACLALASNTSIPGSIARPIEDLATNAIGLLHLLQYGRIQHLVYLSSGAVYIGLEGLVSPASATTPDLPYAISKLAAEHYIRAVHRRQGRPRAATLVRFFGAYGPYEPARKLYTKLVRRFAFERDPRFTVGGDGENYIDAMYIDDAILALLAVLDRPPAEGLRCLDLGVGSRGTVNELVARAARTFNLEAEITHVGETAEYIRFYIDPQPFARLYNFTPTISLETGLSRLYTHLTHTASRAGEPGAIAKV